MESLLPHRRGSGLHTGHGLEFITLVWLTPSDSTLPGQTWLGLSLLVVLLVLFWKGVQRTASHSDKKGKPTFCLCILYSPLAAPNLNTLWTWTSDSDKCQAIFRTLSRPVEDGHKWKIWSLSKPRVPTKELPLQEGKGLGVGEGADAWVEFTDFFS